MARSLQRCNMAEPDGFEIRRNTRTHTVMISTTRRSFLIATAPLLALPQLLAQSSEFSCDIAVIGAGVGGFAAALAALRNGMRVVLTEETDWIGGQLTSQAVPPDEHPWIEEFGCTRSYREYRNAVRDYYP